MDTIIYLNHCQLLAVIHSATIYNIPSLDQCRSILPSLIEMNVSITESKSVVSAISLSMLINANERSLSQTLLIVSMSL